jgi:xylulokinase
VKNEEGAAVGAAVQALWAYRKFSGNPMTIEELCDRYIEVDESTRAKPDAGRVELYQRMQELHNQLVRDLGASFDKHRQMISR